MLIINKYKNPTTKGIYIGRGSPLGNPYPITEEQPRDYVIDKYEKYLIDRIINKDYIIINAINNLNKDSTLICFCSPKRCHGEIIEKIYNELKEKGLDNFIDYYINRQKNKTIIAGSRTINDYEFVKKALIDSKFKPDIVLSGCANGVDKLGEKIAKELNLEIHYYPADWDTYNKKAGYIRNNQMANDADSLVAIIENNSKGTSNMIKLMEDLNKPTFVVNYINNKNIYSKEINMADLDDKPKIYEIAKFNMFADSPGVEGRRARLVWGVRDGNPRITVFTNNPNSKGLEGIISAPMSPQVFIAFLTLFEDVIKGPNDIKRKMDNDTSRRDEDNKPVDKSLLSEVFFGKDSNGIVWISVIAPSKPKIKFEFRLSDYHRFYKTDGTQFTESEASVLEAISVIQCLKALYPKYYGELKVQGTRTYPNSSNTVSTYSKPHEVAGIEDVLF
jgi:hypothetical protein